MAQLEIQDSFEPYYADGQKQNRSSQTVIVERSASAIRDKKFFQSKLESVRSRLAKVVSERNSVRH